MKTNSNYTKVLTAIILLVSFTTIQAQNIYSFKTAGAIGNFGPTQVQLDSTYALTNLFGVKSKGGIQTWTVPTTGLYRIEAIGAQGGSQAPSKFGGKGASMRGDFNLTAGIVLKILVGQQGSSGYGCYGGGGGSFVSDTLNTPLIVAGGGGGAGGLMGGNGIDASAGLNGTAGTAGGSGGINGNGGNAINTNGGSGGGFFSDGSGVFYIPQCSTTAGRSFISGGNGGQFDFWLPGGFGGGGSGWDGNGNGGGGGGYSGGGTSGTSFVAGGGAGSYNNGSNQLNISGANIGNGQVIITSIISTDISELNNTYYTNLYPNPNNGIFTLQSNNNLLKKIFITDIAGRVILSKNSEDSTTNFTISDIASGIYYVSINSNNNTQFIKIIKN